MPEQTIKCLFCETHIAFPKSYTTFYTCSQCGAKYWVMDHNDLYQAPDSAAEAFGLNPEILLTKKGDELFELKYVYNFDIMTDVSEPDGEIGNRQLDLGRVDVGQIMSDEPVTIGDQMDLVFALLKRG